MSNILIALILGMIAGFIDVVPMIRRKVNSYSIAAVYVQWLLLGLVIPFVRWGMAPWLTGIVLGVLGMTPTMIQLVGRNKKAILPTLAYAALLGLGIAVAGAALI